MGRLSLWILVGLTLHIAFLHDVQVSAEVGPSESECRPYIERALHELHTTDSDGDENNETADDEGSREDLSGEQTETKEKSGSFEVENSTETEYINEDIKIESDSDETENNGDSGENTDSGEKMRESSLQGIKSSEDDFKSAENEVKSIENSTNERIDYDDDDNEIDNSKQDSSEYVNKTEAIDVDAINEADTARNENLNVELQSKELIDSDEADSKINLSNENDSYIEKKDDNDDPKFNEKSDNNNTYEDIDEDVDKETVPRIKRDLDNDEESEEDNTTKGDSDTNENSGTEEDDVFKKYDETKEDDDTIEDDNTKEEDDTKEDNFTKEDDDTNEDDGTVEATITKSIEHRITNIREEQSIEKSEDTSQEDVNENVRADEVSVETKNEESVEAEETNEIEEVSDEKKEDADDEFDDSVNTSEADDGGDDETDKSDETRPEDDLLLQGDIPENLRDRKHISELLYLDDEFQEKEKALGNSANIILRDLKRIYENAIKPLEVLYKYRDLSNRHFGDPEIFSKPLVLFMGPWSGGKSTIINYLTENEYTDNSLRSGAEPSPAYFNILMHGEVPEVLDGTQLAADYTFSGLQKFGQGLEDRLRGLKLNNKLLEKVNIVEIPGILEVRKQVSRLFPFNDACQWFIDRADIIFLVYDPAKLDVGPETEAILDQLKGREYQTRIVLNKADLVKPEELLRVQSALIWNISPLMSSAQPPVMYTTSLWSHPYETTSPVRLLQAQERAFLRDLRAAVDKRIDHKIASARRFAVRVRNHAKMVDCYLTTYYNHKSLFGNKKRIADQIIENPQNYHIYEGLSTLTNISRYDLPDPEVYRDFFHLNPLYEFKKLSETCTYFRGCPINKLDVAIAYDLPELVGKYKKMAEAAVAKLVSTDTEKDKS